MPGETHFCLYHQVIAMGFYFSLCENPWDHFLSRNRYFSYFVWSVCILRTQNRETNQVCFLHWPLEWPEEIWPAISLILLVLMCFVLSTVFKSILLPHMYLKFFLSYFTHFPWNGLSFFLEEAHLKSQICKLSLSRARRFGSAGHMLCVLSAQSATGVERRHGHCKNNECGCVPMKPSIRTWKCEFHVIFMCHEIVFFWRFF